MNKLRRQNGIVAGVCGGLGAFYFIDPAEMARQIEDVTTKWHLDFVSLTTNPNQVYL